MSLRCGSECACVCVCVCMYFLGVYLGLSLYDRCKTNIYSVCLLKSNNDVVEGKEEGVLVMMQEAEEGR